MNLSSLRVLLDYHYWARDRMLDAAQVLTLEQYTRDMGNSFRSVRDTVVHIYSAEWVWHSRWNGHSPMAAIPTEQFPDVDTIRTVWSELEAKMRAFLESMGKAASLVNSSTGCSAARRGSRRSGTCCSTS